MRRQGQDVMQVNLAGIRRDIVNLAHNYSNAQVSARDTLKSRAFLLVPITYSFLPRLRACICAPANPLTLRLSSLSIPTRVSRSILFHLPRFWFAQFSFAICDASNNVFRNFEIKIQV